MARGMGGEEREHLDKISDVHVGVGELWHLRGEGEGGRSNF